MKLSQRVCIACRGDVPPLKGKDILIFKKQINKEWKVIKQHHLERNFTFPDFKSALKFVNKVGAIAEKEGHHPNIDFTYGKVKITLYTHKIDGLFDNDFILASKIDQLK